MKAVEISAFGPAGRPASGRAARARGRAGRTVDPRRRQWREPAGRAPAHRELPGAARRIGYSGPRGRGRDRFGRCPGDGAGRLPGRRSRLRAGRRWRLCAALRGAGGPMPAGAPGPDRRRGGFAAGNLLHRLEQRVRPRQAAGRRNPAGPGRHQRHRRHGDPDGQGVGRESHRDGRQRRQVPSLSEARRRPRHQLQDAGLCRGGEEAHRRSRRQRDPGHGGRRLRGARSGVPGRGWPARHHRRAGRREKRIQCGHGAAQAPGDHRFDAAAAAGGVQGGDCAILARQSLAADGQRRHQASDPQHFPGRRRGEGPCADGVEPAHRQDRADLGQAK